MHTVSVNTYYPHSLKLVGNIFMINHCALKSYHHHICGLLCTKKSFEDIKWVIRNLKWKDRIYNGKKKKDNRHYNGKKYTTDN